VIAESFDIFVETLWSVGVPYLSPVLIREVPEGEYFFSGFQHDLCSFGKALGQGTGQVVPTGLDISSLLLGEFRAQRCGLATL